MSGRFSVNGWLTLQLLCLFLNTAMPNSTELRRNMMRKAATKVREVLLN